MLRILLGTERLLPLKILYIVSCYKPYNVEIQTLQIIQCEKFGIKKRKKVLKKLNF